MVKRKEPLRKTPFTAAEIKMINHALFLAIEWEKSVLECHSIGYDERCTTGQMRRVVPKEFAKEAAGCKRNIKKFQLLKTRIQNVLRNKDASPSGLPS